MESSKEILIVGAGPTGLTAAMELTRLGIKVRIIDKAEAASTTSKALAVQARTLELFEQRGLENQMLELGNEAHYASLYSNDKLLGSVDFNRIPSRYNYILLIPQSDTEKVLREKIESLGVTIEWKTELINFVQDENNRIIADIKLPDGTIEHINPVYLISAEGAHSIAREIFGLKFEGKTLGQNYALGDVFIEGDIPTDRLSVFSNNNGFSAVFPMLNNRFRLMVTDVDHTKTDPAPTLEELQKLFEETAPVKVRLSDLQWSSRFGVNSRMLHTLQVGNVFFGGDSAHIHSPAGGQGMNTGIQDMINLCWKIAFTLKGKSTANILETYQEERVPVLKKLLGTTEKATSIFNSTSPATHWIMNYFFPFIIDWDFIQNKGASVVSQTNINYDKSPLSLDSNALGSLSSGDRIPNTTLKINAYNKFGESFQNTSLYSILNPSEFTLLAINADIEIIDVNHLEENNIYNITWSDEMQRETFEGIFGKSSGYVLVRPDSYISLCSGEKGIEKIEEVFNSPFFEN